MNERRKYFKAISDKQKEFNQYVRKARNYYRKRFDLPSVSSLSLLKIILKTIKYTFTIDNLGLKV